MSEKKMIKTICVDTLNGIQNNEYMGMLDKKTMVTRDKWRDFGVAIYMFMVEGLQKFGFETVLVLGYEGTGKSFGIRYLEPGTNIWYNADNKNPTFRVIEFGGNEYNAREVYGTKVKPTPYMFVPKTYKDIITHIQSIQDAGVLAENPVAFLTGHIEDYRSGDGDTRQRLKTLGNLATKMNIEGSVENCLYTYLDTQGERPVYKLDTMNSGSNTARALHGAFGSRYIDNNFQLIYDAITSY
jgi:hypothetical protein